MRLCVYTDFVYRRQGETVYARDAFAVFLAAVASHFERTTIAGRLEPEPGAWHYPLPPHVEFLALPHYATITQPFASIRAVIRSLGRFWRMLPDVDVVWLLGPHVLAFAFSGIALLRGRRVVLGVRQDLPRYVRGRHPGRRWIHLAAHVLEEAFRALARRVPVVVVGPELAWHYGRSRRRLVTAVSLVREADLAEAEAQGDRDYDGELGILSVGRLESEKNPLLLADILASLCERSDRWRLTVCGEGPLMGTLRDRLATLGVGAQAELLGYVPVNSGLRDVYRRCHVLLHVSWTEGLPQILFEAFAARLPVVATAVGGVPDAVGQAALLVPPGDAGAAADALERIAAEPDLRTALVEAGSANARTSTMEAESRRVADFISGSDPGTPR